MTYSRAEQETSIVWDEEQKVARIYTASPATMRKLDKLCEVCPDEYTRTWTETDKKDRVTAAKYEVAAKLVKFGKPASEARKEAGRRAVAAMREKLNSQW